MLSSRFAPSVRVQEAQVSIKAQYGRSVRSQLRHFPVWDIGTPVSIRDYGIVQDNCFTKLGKINEEFIAMIESDVPRPASFWEFKSEGTTVL